MIIASSSSFLDAITTAVRTKLCNEGYIVEYMSFVKDGNFVEQIPVKPIMKIATELLYNNKRAWITGCHVRLMTTAEIKSLESLQ